MTTANKVTILRILLVPFFVVEVLYYVQTANETHRLVAILCFAVASICDGVDGYIARHYNQISELGTILDPLADKLLLVSAVVVLSFNHAPHLGPIPLWLTVTILGRDILLLIGLGVVYITIGKVKVRPRLVGKIATVLQMACVLWLLLKWDVALGRVWTRWLTVSAAAFTGVSGLWYIWDGARQLATSPKSFPSGNPPAAA
jgi:CDP-diacylglycerol--glycerol-3-phosphate 3-phosphatidyltransferase